MDIQNFISNIAAGDNAEAKDTLDGILSAKAFDALQSHKQELALFKNIQLKGKKPIFMDIVFRQSKSHKKEYVYEYERKQTAKKPNPKSKEIKLSELQKLAKKYGQSK